MIELIQRALNHRARIAVVDEAGSYTYGDLLVASESVAFGLLAGAPSLEGARVATMVPPGFEYVAVQWGIWLAGGIAVPLALTHPDAELSYVLDDAEVTAIVAASDYFERMSRLAARRRTRVLEAGVLLKTARAGPVESPPGEDALLLYTSGTTGRPKGVVWRHSAIQAQAEIMSTAWEWQADDRALLVLPLHHVHGLINVTTTALWNGAIVEMHSGFDTAEVWGRLGSGAPTVFMAVPTIYRRLLDLWDSFGAAQQDALRATLGGMRLMVSGSAALPVGTLEAWRAVSGHVLLERYGMTEIGMALSNSYRGERIPGAVGRPLPTVEARVVDDTDTEVHEGVAGLLQVRGPSVFRRYWQRPEETAASFADGWFRTGDSVVVSEGIYRILGRESVDIIKTGGEKVSALEIEDVLRGYPGLADCAVVGLPDPDWGERVGAAVIMAGPPPTLQELLEFCRDRLAPEKLPRTLRVVDKLPRNALGKVLKPQVKELFA